MIHPSYAVLEHNLVAYRRVWRGTVFSSFLLPVLFLLGIGASVGVFINARGTLRVDYLDYLAPGLLASTALQVAVGEATWPVFASFVWLRTYHAMRATSLRVSDILVGHLAFVLFRVLIAAISFLLVMVAFGTVHSVWAVAAIPVCVLAGLAITAPVFAYSATINSDGMFAVLMRFAIIPMTLFAGVFFPVNTMPLAARVLAYITPLWHGVELCRAAILGTATAWGIGPHIGCLVLWSAAGFWLARRQFERKLVD
jgi:lipooligosaccharide transport system permease protein